MPLREPGRRPLRFAPLVSRLGPVRPRNRCNLKCARAIPRSVGRRGAKSIAALVSRRRRVRCDNDARTADQPPRAQSGEDAMRLATIDIAGRAGRRRHPRRRRGRRSRRGGGGRGGPRRRRPGAERQSRGADRRRPAAGVEAARRVAESARRDRDPGREGAAAGAAAAPRQERLLRRPQLRRAHRRGRAGAERADRRHRGAGVLHQAADRGDRSGRGGADLPARLDEDRLRGRARGGDRHGRARHPARARARPRLRLHDPQRHQRARRAAPPRRAVFQGQGPRRVLSARPLDRDRRRHPRPRGPRHPAAGSTASCGRTRPPRR